MIKCNVSNVAIEITETETLTAGRVGLECQFTFSSEWDGLAITAYFLGSTTKAVVVNGNTVTVPAESMAEPGYKLYVGVVGKNAQGNIVIPTLWASAGKIKRSPGEEEEATPSPDVVAQIQLMAMEALEKATYAKGVIDDNLEAITEAGETQTEAVNTEGSTQVLAIQTESSTQQAAIAAAAAAARESIPEDYTALSDDVDDLKSALETFEDGFGNLNLWGEAELLYADRYADVSPNTGKVIYRENAYNIGSWLLEVDGTKTYTSSQPMRTLVPLQEDKETATTPTNVALANVYSIDLNNYPNTKYLAISLEGITSTVISVGTTAQNGTVYPTWLYEFNHGKRPSYNATYSGITSGSSVGLPVSNCLRKNSRLMFVAEISSYGELEIGYATGENGTGVKYNRFIIRRNAIVPYTYYDYSASAMHQDDNVQHNLAITSGNVEVVIEELPDAKCRLTIGNNGNSFVHTFDGWVRNNRLSPYITANWSIFGKSFFSWTCTDLSKGVWLLGDSYMAYEPERWAYYLEQNGYADNVLISSFPGAWSSTNIASFEMLLKYGTPKYAVWAMGMNDGGDSDSAPSNSWVTGRDNFLALCANNHITPIFCTIPTVPTVNNEQKNAWVRASGYRYIDFAKAVLATSSGAWGTGMLSGDGVHPTANGAKALYYQALTDFPEIMLA